MVHDKSRLEIDIRDQGVCGIYASAEELSGILCLNIVLNQIFDDNIGCE